LSCFLSLSKTCFYFFFDLRKHLQIKYSPKHVCPWTQSWTLSYDIIHLVQWEWAKKVMLLRGLGRIGCSLYRFWVMSLSCCHWEGARSCDRAGSQQWWIEPPTRTFMNNISIVRPWAGPLLLVEGSSVMWSALRLKFPCQPYF
jgi:hypothetical protein